MDMDDVAVANLFSSLATTESLRELAELSLVDNKVNPQNCRLVAQWLKALAGAPLQSLGLGPLADAGAVVNALIVSNVQLAKLCLVNSELNDAACVGLESWLQSNARLASLDVNRARISDKSLGKCLKAVAGRSPLALDLSRIGFTNGRLRPFLPVLRELAGNLTVFKFEDNSACPDDLDFFDKCLNLRSVAIGGRFGGNRDQLLKLLLKIISDTPRLEEIALLGLDATFVRDAAVPLISAMAARKALRSIDLRRNALPPSALLALAKLVGTSSVIETILLDDFGMDALDAVIEFVEACGPVNPC
jgi:hypothetical protein